MSAANAGGKTSQWTDGQGVGAGAGTDDEHSGSSGGSGGGSSAPVCHYIALTPDQGGRIEEWRREGLLSVDDGTGPGSWYLNSCTDATGNVQATPVWIAQAAVDPVALAQQALDYTSIPAPQLALNPAADRIQLVNLPVWLAVTGDGWKPASASASAGGVTVTTTATPTQVVWNMGDGNSVTCNGPGATYDPNLADTAQHSDCTYTYRISSAGQPNNSFAITATEQYHVTWTAMGLPAGTPATGDLGTITRVATAAVRVGEVQALNQGN